MVQQLRKQKLDYTRLFTDFLAEKEYINNLSPWTLRSYRQAYRVFNRVVGEVGVAPTERMNLGCSTGSPAPLAVYSPLSRETLKDFIIGCRKEGLATKSINVHLAVFNSFFTWLFENGYHHENIKLKKLKEEQRFQRFYTENELRTFINYKPKSYSMHRLHALLCTLLDTGIRIDEALTLKRANLDFDNLYIVVVGKGKKQRLVPISVELRKVLFKFLSIHNGEFVFPTKAGHKTNYNNLRKDFLRLAKRLKIDKPQFHAFRRSYAIEYLKSGGNVLYLQRCLGHQSLETTKIYAIIADSDLQRTHLRTSILSRLK